MDVVIGMPRALPPESRYTLSAQAWADAEVCEHVLADLDPVLVDADVKIGVADLPMPEVKLTHPTGRLREREILKLSRHAAEAALTDIRDRAETCMGLPPGLDVIRSLHVVVVTQEHRIDEYRLWLDDLSRAQAVSLLLRGWTLAGRRAGVTLPPDAYDREVEWLTARRII